MKYTLFNNDEKVREFSDYPSACLFALMRSLKGSAYIRNDVGDKMPVIRHTGVHVMYQHYECEVVAFHDHTIDLKHLNASGIPVTVMGVKPSQVRPIGSKASETYYRTMMANKLIQDKPGMDYSKSIRDMLAMQLLSDATTPMEREFNCRINGFLSAVDNYIIAIS